MVSHSLNNRSLLMNFSAEILLSCNNAGFDVII